MTYYSQYEYLNVCDHCGHSHFGHKGCPVCSECSEGWSTLWFLRSVMNSIHDGGNIFYDKTRYEAYSLVAKLASRIRQEGTMRR